MRMQRIRADRMCAQKIKVGCMSGKFQSAHVHDKILQCGYKLEKKLRWNFLNSKKRNWWY